MGQLWHDPARGLPVVTQARFGSHQGKNQSARGHSVVAKAFSSMSVAPPQTRPTRGEAAVKSRR